jgi:hypothetical protein
MWNPGNYSHPGGEPSEGQWLYCLKTTRPGDRQVVWLGKGSAGIVAVVDFNGAVRLRGSGRLYEGWGRVTELRKPIPSDVVLSHPVLKPKFKNLMSVSSLDKAAAEAIRGLADGLPEAPGFGGQIEDWDEEGGDWGNYVYELESVAQRWVAEDPELWKELRFPSRPLMEKWLSPTERADLWCPEGVVGEVKPIVTSKSGPDQIGRYIATCDRQWPEYRWKGILVQGEDYLTMSARERVDNSVYRDRITLWCVVEEDVEDPAADDDDVDLYYEQLWP